MRSWLGSWGSELGVDDLGRALAAAGVQLLVEAARGTPPPGKLPLGVSPWSWRWPDLRKLMDPGTLARAWEDFVQRHRAPRIAIEPANEPEAGASIAVQRLFARDAVIGGGAAFVSMKPAGATVPWQWPLDMATVSGPLGDRVAGVRGAPGHDALFRMRRLGEPHWRASVLVLPCSLASAVEAVVRLHRSVRACVVIVLGRPASSEARTGAMIDMIARLTHARAIAVGVAAAEWQPFLERFVAEISHDCPLDVALARAAKGPECPVIIGDPALFATTRLSNRLASAARDLASVGRPDELADLGLAKDAHPPAGTSRAEPPVSWGPGTDTAVRLANCEKVISDEATRAAPRYLHARVAEAGGKAPLPHLAANHAYCAQVKVGPRDAGFLSVPDEVAGLPVSDRTERLTVVFSEPVLCPIPQVGWLDLPPAGATNVCSFAFRTAADTAQIEARIMVLYDGRVLQTGVLRGACDGVSPITFERDAVARVQLAGFDNRAHFAAAVVASHAGDGVNRFVAATAEGRAARLMLSGGDLAALTSALGAAFDALKNDARPQRALRDPASVAALTGLARHGALFHDALVADNEVGPELLRDDPIQIVSARAGAFLPIELAYCWPAPKEGAALCEHAEAGLAAGACAPDCGGGTRDRLCPLGFWSLRRVIERCTFRASEQHDVGDFGVSVEPLRGRQKLVRPAGVVLAASERANHRVPTVVSDLAAALAKAVGGAPPIPATTWDEWIARVSSAAWPPLLVLVPHHTSSEGEEVLEIGPAQKLGSADLEDRIVMGQHARGVDAAPIVVLAGCETLLAGISYESFVTRFRQHGAAVVIGTIASVLGLDAGPVAGELAAALTAEFGHAPPRTLGDVMLGVRRKLVAAGHVMVLALSAYGDADWELG